MEIVEVGVWILAATVIAAAVVTPFVAPKESPPRVVAEEGSGSASSGAQEPTMARLGAVWGQLDSAGAIDEGGHDDHEEDDADDRHGKGGSREESGKHHDDADDD